MTSFYIVKNNLHTNNLITTLKLQNSHYKVTVFCEKINKNYHEISLSCKSLHPMLPDLLLQNNKVVINMPYIYTMTLTDAVKLRDKLNTAIDSATELQTIIDKIPKSITKGDVT